MRIRADKARMNNRIILCLTILLALAPVGHAPQASDRQPDNLPVAQNTIASTGTRPLEIVLRDLAVRFGFDIRGAVQGDSAGPEVHDLKLDLALQRILKGYNYVLLSDEGSAKRTLVILGKAERAAGFGTPTPASSAAGRASSVASSLTSAVRSGFPTMPPALAPYATGVSQTQKVLPGEEGVTGGSVSGLETPSSGQVTEGGPGRRRSVQSSGSIQAQEPASTATSASTQVAQLEAPPTPQMPASPPSSPANPQPGALPFDPGLLIPPQVPF
jgi:hypothetical protein